MFPSKGAPAGPPRNMRDVRREVGTARPEPVDAGPSQNSAEVTLTCPNCGAQVRQSFQAEPAATEPSEPVQAPAGAGPAGF